VAETAEINSERQCLAGGPVAALVSRHGEQSRLTWSCMQTEGTRYPTRVEKCIRILAALMETVHRTIQSAEKDGDRHAISKTGAHE
jgi:hypothetical protein